MNIFYLSLKIYNFSVFGHMVGGSSFELLPPILQSRGTEKKTRRNRKSGGSEQSDSQATTNLT